MLIDFSYKKYLLTLRRKLK